MLFLKIIFVNVFVLYFSFFQCYCFVIVVLKRYKVEADVI